MLTKNKFIIGGAVVALAAVVGWVVWTGNQRLTSESRETDLKLPALSTTAIAGKALFDRNCAVCHGSQAAGSKYGPPLVHKIYEPSHHGDLAFQMAVKQGVRSHHWRFGNMPPIVGVSKAEVVKITHYVRELQRANGIQ